MRVLIVANMFPYPPISGGRLRVYSLMKRIAQHHQVTLAAHIRTPDELEYAEQLRGELHAVLTGRLVRTSPLAHAPGLLRHALRGVPLELKFTFSNELADRICQSAQAQDFDIVQIEESILAPYLEVLPRSSQARLLLTFYDVGYKQAQRLAAIETRSLPRWRLRWYSRQMRRWEPRYAGRFDRCMAVSDMDRETLLRANPRLNVEVVPNGVDTRRYQPLPLTQGPPALLFVGGMNYLPCIDAMTFFCSQVLPLVRQQIPQIELWIVGSNPAPEVRALASDTVHVTGRVPEVEPYYERAHVVVVPLRAGGGTRLKILEALALGRAVVSSRIGCEGLDVVPEEHLLVADSPEAFAARVVRLLSDPQLYERLRRNGRQRVVERYDWDAIAGQVMRIYNEVLG